MSRRKDWEELSPRTRARYDEVIARAFGKKTPTYVPEYSSWPESIRRILRAALQAYWAARDDEAKGIMLSTKIKKGRMVERAAEWPTKQDADVWLLTAERTAPRAAFLISKIAFKRGMRSEEVLSTPREAWQSALRYGRLKFIGKGNKERVLVMSNMAPTLREMLELPGALPHAKREAAKFDAPPVWRVPGELLARPGSSVDTQRNLLSRYMKKVAVAAGLNPDLWHPHTFRHVFADRYTGSGRNLQEALGHATAETMIRYTHPTPEDVAKNFEGD